MFPTPLRRAKLVASLLLAPALASPLTAAATAEIPSVQPTAAAADSEHVALRDAIWRLERDLRQRLTSTGRGAPVDSQGNAPKLSEMDELLRALRDSGRKLQSAGGIDLARKADALEMLLREVERRESGGGNVTSSVSSWDLPASSPHLDVARASSCAEAVAVREGGLVAALAPRAGSANVEIWLRYTARAGGAAMVSTSGSDFDTVVEVYSSCPAAGSGPIARGDDEIGLQSRVSFRTAKGDTSWIRVTGADGATGSLALQLDGGLGGFAGVVTNEATGQGTGSSVRVFGASGAFVTAGYPDNDGSYLVSLPSGTYYASTFSNDYAGLLDELYDDLPCAGGAPAGCSPTSGQPIVVRDGVVNGIDFALGHGAAIAGHVRDAETGEPIANMFVEVYGSAGQLVRQIQTDSVGRFLARGLASGTAFAVAGPHYGPYRRELYQDIGCLSVSCHVTTGTPIAVVDGRTTSGIDFSLERAGGIGGTLTRQADGSPVGYAQVTIWDQQGHEASSVYTDGLGAYTSEALDAGSYFVKTETFGAFEDELYDDVPCEPSCFLTAGTPVAVTLAHVTSGIDLALRRMGTISGSFSDALSGDPIYSYFTYGAYVSVFDSNGVFLFDRFAWGADYEVTGLRAGTYYLKASHPYFRSELHDNLPCANGCEPTTGTPIVVTIDGDVTGIDFALTPLGSISGTVTDAGTHAPIFGQVQVWRSSGELVTWADVYDDGNYKIRGLADGSYFVTASNPQHTTGLYDDIPCPGGPPTGCALTNGTAVPAALGTSTTGIDFALITKGKIVGTVRDASTHQPLLGATVWVFNSSGTQVTQTSSNSNGEYEIVGLDPGSYFVVADGYDPYDAEVYDDVACPIPACNPSIGTPVAVTLGATTSGIDFGLSPSRVITGVVSAADGQPLSSTGVDLYDSAGQYRGDAYTDSQGRYRLPAEPGTWYLVARGGYQYQSQLYSGIPCPNGCNVTAGTPVGVTRGVDTTNIDFVLSYARGIAGRVTDTGHPLAGVAIDVWNAAGEHVRSTVTVPNGTYHVEVDPGTYFVSTDSGMGAIEELWNNIPCPLGPAYEGLCDPTTGTPITIASSDTPVSGVDFALDRVQLFANGFEPGGRAWSATWPP